MFLAMAWNKFTNWDSTMEFLKANGTSVGLPSWFVAVYALLLPFAEALTGLLFLLGFCSKLSGTLLFLLTFSFWLVLSSNPQHPDILKDFHFYLMLLGLIVFSFGFGKYKLLQCNGKCCAHECEE